MGPGGSSFRPPVHPNVRVIQETEEHARLWSDLLRTAATGGDLTTDACIAAIALAHEPPS